MLLLRNFSRSLGDLWFRRYEANWGKHARNHTTAGPSAGAAETNGQAVDVRRDNLQRRNCVRWRPALIPPLRKRTKQGTLYTRSAAVETLIVEMADLPRDQLLERAAIRNRRAAGWIPSECLLHLLRASRSENSDAFFERLFTVVSERVKAALPRKTTGDEIHGRIERTAERVHELAFDKFQDLLCGDRQEYDERLDFFEARFDLGVANLRRDAKEKAYEEENRGASLEYDWDTGEPSPEVEHARGAFDPFEPALINEEDYRIRLRAAIGGLPPEQIRIVEMISKGIPIDSIDKSAVSISKLLGRSEKTIRTHRDKAYAAIRAAMQDELRS